MTWGHEAWGESKLKGIDFPWEFLIHLLSLVEHVGRLKTWMVDALCFELSIHVYTVSCRSGACKVLRKWMGVASADPVNYITVRPGNAP